MGDAFAFAVALLRPWIVRVPLGIWATVASYDGISNQMGWPKIPELWGMTGSPLPWWGWLLVAQGILVLALFEYVRRNISTAAVHSGLSDEQLSKIAERMVASIWRENIEPVMHDSFAAMQAVTERNLLAHVDERFEAQINQIATPAGEFAGFIAGIEKRLI